MSKLLIPSVLLPISFSKVVPVTCDSCDCSGKERGLLLCADQLKKKKKKLLPDLYWLMLN